MKARLITFITVSLLLLFTLGGVCGYAVSSRATGARPSWAHKQQWISAWMERHRTEEFTRLGITGAQEEKVRPSYEQLLSDMQAIQRDSEQKVAEAFKRHARDVWPQLTPAQREELRQLQAERTARRSAPSNPNP